METKLLDLESGFAAYSLSLYMIGPTKYQYYSQN